jgi:hypothetical protein
VEIWYFALAAALLSVERACYAFAWRRTPSFVELCERLAPLGGEPLQVLERLFYGFKALQLGVFAGWCLVHAHGALWPLAARAELPVLLLGAGAVAVGQALNFAVFHRLGRTGVFYGNRLGYEVPWCEGFPFSVLRHPQYVGAVLSIWGLFLVARFPNPDWIALPLLETLYYVLGAHLESDPDC